MTFVAIRTHGRGKVLFDINVSANAPGALRPRGARA
jgi:hypothetical protein